MRTIARLPSITLNSMLRNHQIMYRCPIVVFDNDCMRKGVCPYIAPCPEKPEIPVELHSSDEHAEVEAVSGSSDEQCWKVRHNITSYICME